MNKENYNLRWSAPGVDNKRDPQVLGDSINFLVRNLQWQEKLRTATFLAEFSTIVGSEIANHISGVSLEDKTLTIRAVSTAWATQLRYLQTSILQKIHAHNSVKINKIIIAGPQQPSWRFGPRHIAGRGPRDTYG